MPKAVKMLPLEKNNKLKTRHGNSNDAQIKSESLKEALRFFLMNTLPTEKYYPESKNSIVLLIGNSVDTDDIKSF